MARYFDTTVKEFSLKTWERFGGPMRHALETATRHASAVEELNKRYREGNVRVHLPPGFSDAQGPLESVVAASFPLSRAALEEASQGLFLSLPVAFDPAAAVGPYLATVDCDADGEPYRFLDMGAQIATHAFGENDPVLVAALLENIQFCVDRYAHSEYQTTLSLRLKSALRRIAPAGTPRFFVVNTGAEAVENAIKAALLHRVKTVNAQPGVGAAVEPPIPESAFFVVSFEGAFHGRTLGSLAVTHRRKARIGFPTFDWPKVEFPVEEPSDPGLTLRREEKSLKQVWDLLYTGRQSGVNRPRELFQRQLADCARFLESMPSLPESEKAASVGVFVKERRAELEPAVLARSRRAAAILVEPIQGEGGIRFASPGFFQRLRLLTLIYDVPLIFDEVQMGWGATGRMWAHELFNLPAPPDAVVWAKKAQNGVLFVSEELAAFFQEEKKFNTTWEGDSVGMSRLLVLLDRLDLERVRRTGGLARSALDTLAADFPEIIKNVRGVGTILAFDLIRPDWRDSLRERAFRLGLLLLPAGERALRFYPHYDIETYAIDEAVTILRRAMEGLLGTAMTALAAGPELRIGTIDLPMHNVEVVELTADKAEAWLPSVMRVEVECYGDGAGQRPDGTVGNSGRPPLQYPSETLEATMAHSRSMCLGLRDRVTGSLEAYALGSPLENHDEEGVRDDPFFGEGRAFYLQAMAVSTSVRNHEEVEVWLLDALRSRLAEAGFEWISMLIEERLRSTGPEWLAKARTLRTIKNYLRSGLRFVYLQAPCRSEP